MPEEEEDSQELFPFRLNYLCPDAIRKTHFSISHSLRFSTLRTTEKSLDQDNE
jgi:hypothetical protein